MGTSRSRASMRSRRAVRMDCCIVPEWVGSDVCESGTRNQTASGRIGRARPFPEPNSWSPGGAPAIPARKRSSPRTDRSLTSLPILLLPLLSSLQGAPGPLDLREAYDVEAYELELAVRPESETLEWSVAVVADSKREPLREVQLDLYALYEVLHVTDGRGGPSSSNGRTTSSWCASRSRWRKASDSACECATAASRRGAGSAAFTGKRARTGDWSVWRTARRRDSTRGKRSGRPTAGTTTIRWRPTR